MGTLGGVDSGSSTSFVATFSPPSSRNVLSEQGAMCLFSRGSFQTFHTSRETPVQNPWEVGRKAAACAACINYCGVTIFPFFAHFKQFLDVALWKVLDRVTC